MVALINTLFKFSESLAAVEDFRKLWRVFDEPSPQQVVSGTEEFLVIEVRLAWITFLLSTT